jgi:hypothetical protein
VGLRAAFKLIYICSKVMLHETEVTQRGLEYQHEMFEEKEAHRGFSASLTSSSIIQACDQLVITYEYYKYTSRCYAPNRASRFFLISSTVS